MSAVNIALIAVAAQRKKITDRLLRAEADCPERALARDAIGNDSLSVLRNLRKEGIVVATPSGQLYLNRQRLAARNLENRIGVQLLLGMVVLVAVVAGLIGLVHAA